MTDPRNDIIHASIFCSQLKPLLQIKTHNKFKRNAYIQQVVDFISIFIFIGRKWNIHFGSTINK